LLLDSNALEHSNGLYKMAWKVIVWIPPIVQYLKSNYKKVLLNVFYAVFGVSSFYYGVVRYNQEKATSLMFQERNNVLIYQRDSVIKNNNYQRFQIESLALARASVENCLELFPKPAWRKVYNEELDVFIMDDLNLAYSNNYIFDVSRAQYMGSLDKLAHGTERAKEYELGDRMALGVDVPVIRYETVFDKKLGKTRLGRFMKWKKIIDKRIFIYGMEIELIN
jgi:hypothetical protein